MLRLCSTRYRTARVTSADIRKTLLSPILREGCTGVRSQATMSAIPLPELKQATEEVTELLRDRGESVAVAETAAGGLISSSLLSQPGASKYYKGGLTVR